MKRLTKQQKEDQQRAALLQRVTDVYSGAVGAVWADEDWATAQVLSRVIPALEGMFIDPAANKSFLFRAHNIDRFDTPEAATNFLFEYGVRA
jgi:ribosomal protein S12 methylthiotransferase accessory factor YcaO